MSDVLERAEAMLAKITERGRGWEARYEYDELTRVVHSGEWEGSLSQCCDCGVEAGYPNDADAEFIAAAPELVRDLLADVAEREATLRAMRAWRADAIGERDEWRETAIMHEETVDQYRELSANQSRRVDALQAKIDAALTLHKSTPCCAECSGRICTNCEYVDWPCPTARALGETC